MKAETMPVTLGDAFGRPLRDLRVSVTDRCNFRCVYCMPKEIFGPGYAFLPREEILTFEEIERLVRLFARLGVKKIRLTGGEPLLRKELAHLVARVSAVPGIEDVALTTNGALLAAQAEALARAGLRRVTVSLDALDDPTFMAMNDVRFPVGKVLEGIEAAAAAGLSPVKVNAVIKRGVNEHAVLDLARHFRRTPHVVRFIEYMDVGNSNGWRLDDVVPATEMLRALDDAWGIEPLEPTAPGEVATRYRYRDGAGEVGVIASVTRPFCRACTRARLSTDGKLYTCLFAGRGHDLRAMVRGGASDDEIASRLRSIWTVRRDRYSELRSARTKDLKKVEMSYIGG